MSKHVKSYKHDKATRSHIPSREEAGTEAGNPNVQAAATTKELPLNPVTSRGQDPELWWLNKYGQDDRETLLNMQVRSLYRHEHIAPELLIKNLYRIKDSPQMDMFNADEVFGNALNLDEEQKVSEYYQHQDGWTNRLIQGDSLLVMTSLLEREGMAGQVQTIYLDPPYGIKYGSNWQVKMNNRDVKDGADEALAGEPEQIKAFRDTWELGIHSYLSYLRDRLVVAKELLHESGSCFVQISDENVHLVRCLMDEVFGSENYSSTIAFRKTSSAGSISGGTDVLASTFDYVLWYGKNKDNIKYRQLYVERKSGEGEGMYTQIELPNGTRRRLTQEEKLDLSIIPQGSKIFRADNLTSQSGVDKTRYEVHFEGKIFKPSKGVWKTGFDGMQNLLKQRRVINTGANLSYVRYFSDFPFQSINNLWEDTGLTDKLYIVQTTRKVIERCILMTTDPGDLVLDPTCGSGTTAFVAEQWGRRWVTIDTSRIALNIAKQRLMTATFPYYKLYSEQFGDEEGMPSHTKDLRQGFVYKTVPHITLKSLANDEPPATETLYDQPEVDKKKMRVSGPFTVETLQNDEPVSPDALAAERNDVAANTAFEDLIRNHLVSAGIKNGRKDEMVRFTSVDMVAGDALHAQGYYTTAKGEEKAYFHIGPRFGTVSKAMVNAATKECRSLGDANWLVILGFSFESDIANNTATTSYGSFEVTKCRMHDDFLQEGLKKKPAKSAASFVTIGEPDVELKFTPDNQVFVEVKGLDIYDPISDQVKPRNLHDIAYWMVDTDYDETNFVVRQVYFCGGDKDEFNKWKKGLSDLAKEATKKKLERTLKIEIDEEAFDRLYGYQSNPIAYRGKQHKLAVRLVSQYGEECTKVLKG